MATKVKESAAVATTSSKNGGSLISDDKLKQLYATMLKCRLMEEKALGLKKMARFKGNYYAAVGQEAAVVGAAIDLRNVIVSQSNAISRACQGPVVNPAAISTVPCKTL